MSIIAKTDENLERGSTHEVHLISSQWLVGRRQLQEDLVEGFGFFGSPSASIGQHYWSESGTISSRKYAKTLRP